MALAALALTVMLLGILWPRTNYPGALFGIAGGLVIQTAAAVALPKIRPGLNFLYIAFIAELIIVAGVVVISLATPPPPRQRWEPFQWTPALLAQLRVNASKPWYANVWLWAAVYAAIWVTIYAWFW